jgi:hypothetical protein
MDNIEPRPEMWEDLPRWYRWGIMWTRAAVVLATAILWIVIAVAILHWLGAAP